MSQDVRLTDRDDVYVHPNGADWKNIFGGSGNDTITIHGNAKVIGGPGNDLVTSNNNHWNNYGGGVAYWDSPRPVRVDLGDGYAEDGWGGRDTLVGIRDVSLSGLAGDRVFGSSQADLVWINLDRRGESGDIFFDGRAGIDRAAFWELSSKDVTINVSSDGASATVSRGSLRAVLTNVEELQFESRGTLREVYSVQHFIDRSSLGPKVLIEHGYTGWASDSRANGLTYSFASEMPSYGGGEGGEGFVPASASYRAAVRVILSGLSEDTGLSFKEVEDSANSFGQLRFASNKQSSTKGYAFIPGQVSDARAGDVWLDVETTQLLQPGQEGWYVLLHEIGHALGLKHPLPQGSSGVTRDALLNAWNHDGLTVMSERNSPDGIWQTWFGPFDLQALRAMYGPGSKRSGPGDDIYRLNDNHGTMKFSIFDSGGYDKIDASGLSSPAYISLVPGSFSSIGISPRGSLSFQNMFLDFSASIEEVIGSAYDDVLIGSSGNNAFRPGLGNDIIEGGGGENIVLFDLPLSMFRVQKALKADTFFIDAKDGVSGSNQVTGVQRAYFSDAKLTLNVSDDQSAAARTAKLVGALFGQGGLNNLPLVGRVLSDFESGQSYEQIARKWLESSEFLALSGSRSNAAVVSTVFKNVVGIDIPKDFFDLFTGWLSTRVHTQPSLLVVAAETDINVAMVGLSNVLEGGLAYA